MLVEANASGPKMASYKTTWTLPSRSSIRAVSYTQAYAHLDNVSTPPSQQPPHRFAAFSELINDFTHRL
jgi:hypothetical protein